MFGIIFQILQIHEIRNRAKILFQMAKSLSTTNNIKQGRRSVSRYFYFEYKASKLYSSLFFFWQIFGILLQSTRKPLHLVSRIYSIKLIGPLHGDFETL